VSRSESTSVVPLLRNVSLLEHLPLEDIESLARSVRRVYAQRREIIFHEGDPCTGLHFVVYGRIKISLQSWKGADKPISLVGPGGFFGDITMFLQDPYYRKVQALDDTLLLYLPLRTIKRMIEGDSRFALRLLGSLSEKVRGLVRDIESFSLQPPAARCW
jgi:CRP-like cAMP-binding protein